MFIPSFPCLLAEITYTVLTVTKYNFSISPIMGARFSEFDAAFWFPSSVRYKSWKLHIF